uniref:Uncharacterized protein n=1 Tax=Oryza meridionalis TaxID=40149 RepID=A0A0E0EA92_9ORYZ
MEALAGGSRVVAAAPSTLSCLPPAPDPAAVAAAAGRSGGSGSLCPILSPSCGRFGGIGDSHEWIRRRWRMLSVDRATVAPAGGGGGVGDGRRWIRQRWRRPRVHPATVGGGGVDDGRGWIRRQLAVVALMTATGGSDGGLWRIRWQSVAGE